MNKHIIIAFCILSFFFFGTSLEFLRFPKAFAATSGQINLTKSVSVPVINSPYVRIYAYSFPSPSSMNITNFSGNITFTSGLSYIAQTAVAVWSSPSGICPTDGSMYTDYSQIITQFPGAKNLNFSNLILSSIGSVTLNTPYNFSINRPVSGCIFLTFDMAASPNGIAATTGISTHVNMTITYDSSIASNPVPVAIPLGPEICFGTEEGCTAHTTCTGGTCAYMQVTKIAQPTLIWNLFGNTSAGVFSGSPYANPPVGDWSAAIDLFVYKNCSSLPSGLRGPADFYSTIPNDAIPLIHVPMVSNNLQPVHVPVNTSYATPIALQPGNCIVHLTRYAANGAATINSAIYALLQLQTTIPTPTPLVTVSCDQSAPLDICIPQTDSYTLSISGQQAASSTIFSTWNSQDNMDDLMNYPGIKNQDGSWQTTIYRINHPGIGSMSTNVWTVDASGTQQWCRNLTLPLCQNMNSGDLNNDGLVDGRDYVMMMNNFGDANDYMVWVANYGK